VGAIRSRDDAGGRNRVAVMPSGPNARLARKWSNGSPVTRSTACMSTMALKSE